MRSFAPDAQHEPRGVQTTASKLPRSKRVHEKPPSVEMSLPVRPTASAVPAVCGMKVAPDRYAFGAALSATSVQVRPPSAVRASERGAVAGLATSPPIARPCRPFRNATAKMPELSPLAMGVCDTFQWWPPSVERKTRPPAAPPLPNHASCLPEVVMHSFEAANPNSSGECAFGMLR